MRRSTTAGSPTTSVMGHHRTAKGAGLFAMNMPTELGGGGFTMLQQVLVSEQIGRVTNGLGWCVHTPPGVGALGLHARADRAVDRPRGPW